MYVPRSFPRYRPSTSLAPSHEATRTPAATTAVGHDARPPLTLEWLVARDIDAYTARRRAAATMDAQASTRPSPVSLRKNGTSAVAQS